jgi:transketolase
MTTASAPAATKAQAATSPSSHSAGSSELTAAQELVGTAAGSRRLANAIRALTMDAVEAAKSGHPGMPMGMADVATVLFTRFLKFDPTNPAWPDRDRFVLSAGHGSMLIYALLHLTGYDSVSLEDIRNFRQWGSPAAGHPETGHVAGVETTTGPLGQGIATAVGMALAERVLHARFGDNLVNHKTYVIASDGDLMEGVSHEAAALAGHLKLNRLIVLFDDNGISIDGPTSLSESTDVTKRFEAYGWNAVRVDGHDAQAVAAALQKAQTSDKPVLIACKTVIGFGAPKRAGTSKSHGEALGAEEVAGARVALDWPYAPFEIPDDILSAWRALGGRGTKDRKEWEGRVTREPSEKRDAFECAQSAEIPESLVGAMAAYKEKLSTDKPAIATRKASEMALEIINAHLSTTLGGSADLTGSNLTRSKDMKVVSAADYGGRFVHYGVREHGMAAAMNGIALHGGLVPYSGTFLVFSDYCRPAIRLAALMGKRVIHVMTHDSIGLGEDGPTHQPVEHLASLRAIPNLLVMRPADAVETAECWELALNEKARPTVMALSRQNLPTVRSTVKENLSGKGGYVLTEAEGGKARVTLIATGSEVEIALKARALLQARNVPARVVSMPCWELFEEQSEAYRRATIDPATVRVAIEAAGPMGWERYTGADGAFIGMHGFGASAPAKVLYEKFGITAEAAAEAAFARSNR